MFITFEGLDKAGKSTQIERLAEHLRSLGREVVLTREPGGTPLCEAIRALVMQFKSSHIADESELLLFEASRAQLIRELIAPSLEAGKIVLCDRFADSTVAYQGFARHQDLQTIERLNAFAVGAYWPTLTIFLDLTVEESFRRLGKVLNENGAQRDRFEQEKREFHEGVREGFLYVAKKDPQRVVRIDACQTMDEVEAQIWAQVANRLNLGGGAR
jgi:dTMP kinase